MSNQSKYIVTARLPEALGMRLKQEAASKLCSSSDIIRQALLLFFGPSCLTFTANAGEVQEDGK
jgi:hypothetical protein